jgi:putative pyruvate formate lyase activating enzyme
MLDFTSAYLSLKNEVLSERVNELRQLMRGCILCPRKCRSDRLSGLVGTCQTGTQAIVSSYGPHFGEEAPLVGRFGSGTIFLTHCNLKCIYCQNYDISHLGHGSVVSTEGLARMMLDLQRQGCHNINWVTPTHQLPVLVEALQEAARAGLRLPIVYNCGGYESLDSLRLLHGIIDIYMPDAKYADNAVGGLLSGVPDYWDRCREALAEMHRQVGDLVIDDTGVARRGLLVRHLVLPDGIAGTQAVMKFLARLSTNTYVNVMAQYQPQYRACEAGIIDRPLRSNEVSTAIETALEAGLSRLDQRYSRR